MSDAEGEPMPPRDGTRVEVAQAKGRPMLSWVGKRPLREVRSFPAQLVERFGPATPDVVVSEGDWADWPERFILSARPIAGRSAPCEHFGVQMRSARVRPGIGGGNERTARSVGP